MRTPQEYIQLIARSQTCKLPTIPPPVSDDAIQDYIEATVEIDDSNLIRVQHTKPYRLSSNGEVFVAPTVIVRNWATIKDMLGQRRAQQFLNMAKTFYKRVQRNMKAFGVPRECGEDMAKLDRLPQLDALNA